MYFFMIGDTDFVFTREPKGLMRVFLVSLGVLIYGFFFLALVLMALAWG